MFEVSTPAYRKSWSARTEAEDESWEESRPRVYAAFMSAQGVPAVGYKCTQCNTNVCTVCCLECAHTYQCSECDTRNHEQGLVFHIRKGRVSRFYNPSEVGKLSKLTRTRIKWYMPFSVRILFITFWMDGEFVIHIYILSFIIICLCRWVVLKIRHSIGSCKWPLCLFFSMVMWCGTY